MALATTCPHCKTSFKVVADQLKLRRGLVRCGKCQEVFSGVDYLRYIDEPKPKAPIPVAPIESTQDLDDLKTAFFLPETIFNASMQIDPMTIQAPVPVYIPSPEVAPSAASRASVTTETHHASSALTESDSDSSQASSNSPLDAFSAVEAAALKLSRIPQGLEIEAVDEKQVPVVKGDYVAKSEDDRQIAAHGEVSAIDYRVKPKPVAKRWWVACALLLLLALAQGIIVARNELAIRYPAFQDFLSQVSEPFGLQVELPRRFDALTIESFELQASEVTSGEVQTYLAQALLRNQASHAVQWPAIELSLTDPSGQLLARKVLLAKDYLPASDSKNQGFAARSEKNIRIKLTLNQLNPNGYSAVLFYP